MNEAVSSGAASSGLEAIDLAVLHVINVVWTHPALDVFFVWLTKPPHREVYFIAAALLLLIVGGKRGRIAVLSLAVAIALTDQISAAWLKPTFERMRPCFAYPDEVRLLLAKQARSFSFPSSHAANSFAFALVFFGIRRWVGFAALGLAVLITYSRPYVGVHYPSDSLAGAAIGTIIGGAVLLAQRRIERWWTERRARAQQPLGELAQKPATTTDASSDVPSSPDTPAPPTATRSPRKDGP